MARSYKIMGWSMAPWAGMGQFGDAVSAMDVSAINRLQDMTLLMGVLFTYFLKKIWVWL